MNYAISKLEATTPIIKDNKECYLHGYAFMDQYKHCAVIVYGEKQKELMNKLLNNETIKTK